MIRPATPADLPELERLIESAIRHSVAVNEEDVLFLIEDTRRDLTSWDSDPREKFLLVAVRDGAIAGLVLVKKFWNLCLLFVRPNLQRTGIGRALLEQAIAECRDRSPKNAIWLNSSFAGEAFYRRMGFETLRPAVDRPGGCIPLKFDFAKRPS